MTKQIPVNHFHFPFELDEFQRDAISSLHNDESIVVSAPTGAGKTVVAEFIIQQNMEEGKGVIYTAPVKALSNQKYREFQKLFPGQVGIITGDVSINPFAPLLIMTTEILRNRILENPEGLRNHKWVIFDEIHYLDDMERGTVWEESLILLPDHIRVVGLSATIPNIEQLVSWLREIHPHPVKMIEENHRPVPLSHYFQLDGKILDQLESVKRVGYGRRKRMDQYHRRGQQRRTFNEKNKPMTLLRHLVKNDRLPCIYFAFSRKRCEYLAEQATALACVTGEEQQQILDLYDTLCFHFKITANIRTQEMRDLLKQGIAYHHAGIHPMLKEVIEQLFTRRLIKIIFTTETFALGINMPAKTVVIDELRKRYGRFFSFIRVRDFHQMAGRSGRRGIDRQGYVYSRVNTGEISYIELLRLFRNQPEPVKSRLNTAYATLLNLYHTYGEDLFEIYKRSFFYFQEKKNFEIHQIKNMKAKLNLLKKMGYIRQSKLTHKGHFARNMYGYELTMTELYASGMLDTLSKKEIGILSLAAVFEPRPRQKKPPFPKSIRQLRNATSKIIKRIHMSETRLGIRSMSKKFYFDLSVSLVDWMENRSMAQILDILEIDEGELIRYYRMSIQILREMIEAPISNKLKSKIQDTIHLINHDIINAEEQLNRMIDAEKIED